MFLFQIKYFIKCTRTRKCFLYSWKAEFVAAIVNFMIIMLAFSKNNNAFDNNGTLPRTIIKKRCKYSSIRSKRGQL
jgi:hypothetical protein